MGQPLSLHRHYFITLFHLVDQIPLPSSCSFLVTIWHFLKPLFFFCCDFRKNTQSKHLSLLPGVGRSQMNLYPVAFFQSFSVSSIFVALLQKWKEAGKEVVPFCLTQFPLLRHPPWFLYSFNGLLLQAPLAVHESEDPGIPLWEHFTPAAPRSLRTGV